MTQAPDDARRRARALAELDEVPPETQQERVSGLRARRRVEVLCSVLLAGVVALWLATLVGGPADADDVSGWPLAVSAGTVLAFSVVVGLAWRNSGTLGRARSLALPLEWLTAQERKHLLRQARGRAPVVPEDLPLSRRLAEVRLAQWTYLPLALTAVLMVALHAIAGALLLWDVVFSVVLLAVAAGYAVERRDARRLQAFLDRHPGPGAQP